MSHRKAWKLVTDFEVTRYKCGLRAGDRLRLIRTIRLRDCKGNLTGKWYRRGGILRVLLGVKESPGVVFLRQPSGELHTWDDDKSIFETFEELPATTNHHN